MKNPWYIYVFTIIIVFLTITNVVSAVIPTRVVASPSSTINISDVIFNNSNITLITIEDTNSMLPTFDENNIVLGLPINDETNLSIGDIVVYQKNGGFIIHRIIDIADNGYLLKGDNNKISDGFINISDIKYKAVGVIY